MNHLVNSEITKIAKNTKCNVTCCTRPSWRGVKRICGDPCATSLSPNKVEVYKQITEGEDGGDGAGEPLEPCCDVGTSSDQCVHNDASGLPQQLAICTEDGSDHRGVPRRRHFQ